MEKELGKDIWVIKSTGDKEKFSLEKLRRSLVRSNADEDTIKRIIDHIIPELHDGMKTAQIYKHAYSILKKKKYPAAVRYHGEHYKCKISDVKDGSYSLRLDKPAVFDAGQSVVLYDGEECLGGGVIG